MLNHDSDEAPPELCLIMLSERNTALATPGILTDHMPAAAPFCQDLVARRQSAGSSKVRVQIQVLESFDPATGRKIKRDVDKPQERRTSNDYTQITAPLKDLSEDAVWFIVEGKRDNKGKKTFLLASLPCVTVAAAQKAHPGKKLTLEAMRKGEHVSIALGMVPSREEAWENTIYILGPSPADRFEVSFQELFGEEWFKICPICKEVGTKRCGACKSQRYCSEAHQRAHWKVHKHDCTPSTESCMAAAGAGAGVAASADGGLDPCDDASGAGSSK